MILLNDARHEIRDHPDIGSLKAMWRYHSEIYGFETLQKRKRMRLFSLCIE